MPMNIEELLKFKRKEILAIAAKHGARNLRVFGSVARGEARPESDLDILVEMEPGRSFSQYHGGYKRTLCKNRISLAIDVITYRD